MGTVWEGGRGGNEAASDPFSPLVGTAQLAPGTCVGRYQVLGAIGCGGMGEVYAAYHPDLDRRIALKIVSGARATDPERQARLLREARIIARLNHPNIVAVYDAGVVGDQVYVAMELVDGQTLDAWLRGQNRRWQDVLDVFVAAGRGLAAAHAANLVHRDFKPQNVMIGCDGRVRVMDFGLARDVLDPPEARAPAAGSAPSDRLTSTTVGALVGTPAYMAPEQLRGEPIDRRADQFSFCVALHEAIYGVRPGAGLPWAGSRARRMPGWLRAIIRRGLEHDRDRRHPSMQHLLRAIERGRARLSRRAGWVAVGASLALAAGLAARTARTRQFMCAAPSSRLAAVWEPVEEAGSKRARLHQLFRSSGLENGEATWQRLAGSLDERARQWAGMYQDACEATHVRGDQSAGVLDLRMTCLADALDDTRAYTENLLASNGAVLDRALPTVSALSPIQQCADVKNLQLQFPLPQDPAIRARVVQLQQAMNDADVLLSFRNYDAAQGHLKAILLAARQLGFRPLIAQVLQKLGLIETNLYRLTEAERFGQEALAIAEESHDDLTVAKAAEILGFTVTEMGRFDDARRWLTFGDAVIDRLHAQGSLVKAWYLNDWSVLYAQSGDLQGAERTQREALAMKTRLLGARHPDVAASLANLAEILDEMDRSAEALVDLQQAVAIAEEHAYASSPAGAGYLLLESETWMALGRLDEAEPLLNRATAIAAGDAGAAAFMAMAQADRADLLLLRHRPREALEAIARAKGIASALPVRLPIWAAALEVTQAQAMVESGAGSRHTAEMLVDACRTFERLHHAQRQRMLLEWFNGLSGHARRAPAGSCAQLPRAAIRASARPPVRQLQQNDVRGGAMAEGAG